MMAPAILTNGKPDVKSSPSSKVSSKQNMKKMDPGNHVAEVAKPIDYAALEARLSAENTFICNVLRYIPKQKSGGSDIDDEEETAEDQKTSNVNRVSDPEELKERLAAKLAQFKGKRLDFSENKAKTKLKRKLDKLEKKKFKKKNNKLKAKMAKLAQATQAASVSSSAPTSPNGSVKAEPVSSRPAKPVFNSEGRMVFSKFDFGELTTPTTTIHKQTLDPKAALAKVNRMKEKIKLLEEKGEVEKARILENKQAWEGALQRAEGLKVKDNPEMLLKSIKKKEKQKQQTKKKWSERIETVEKNKEDRQKKRATNIKKKKDEKKEKKLKKLAKKGKIIL